MSASHRERKLARERRAGLARGNDDKCDRAVDCCGSARHRNLRERG